MLNWSTGRYRIPVWNRGCTVLLSSALPSWPNTSPVEASTRYLKHLVDAWNASHPGDPMQKQKVVLTVPASFDDMARNLTVDAARKAGLTDLALIEEPQAAFYCWLATHTPQEAAQLKPGDHCLVVDVGGGTRVTIGEEIAPGLVARFSRQFGEFACAPCRCTVKTPLA